MPLICNIPFAGDRIFRYFDTSYRFFQNLRPILLSWLVVLMIYVDSAVFHPYGDLEAGDNKSMKIQVARPGI